MTPQNEREKENESEREGMCVCVCVCLRESGEQQNLYLARVGLRDKGSSHFLDQ